MKRKFATSTVTSVRCEQKLIELADSMEITLADALSDGILLKAEFKLEENPEKYSAATHDLFVALKKKNLEEFTEWLGMQKLQQKRIAEFAEAKRAADQPEKKIRVYASDVEQTIIIPESQFDPKWHIKKGRVQV